MATMVLTTTDNKSEAEKIAKALLESQKAACVQIMPIDSIYRWEGEIKQDAEYLLFIKTVDKHFEAVQKHILALHSYEVPEVIQIPIEQGSPDYLKWLEESTK